MANQTVSSTLEPWYDLSGKVVMVTGASSRLGWAFSIDLAKAGCRIVAAARRIDRLVSLCNQINRVGETNITNDIRAVAVELDVSGEGPTIEAAVKKAWDAFGYIDVLINNAGVGALPHLAYATSKMGVVTLTKVMALELGKYKIRVNSINPGVFKSEITKGLMEKDWVNNVAQRIVPLRKLGTTDPALTGLVRYLIHDSSEYINGNIFIVDAGTSLLGVPIFSSL